MPDEPKPATTQPPAVVYPTVEQQVYQAHIAKHFEFRAMLRNLRAAMLLFSSDGPIDPGLGALIIHELDGMKLIIESGMKPQALPGEPS